MTQLQVLGFSALEQALVDGLRDVPESPSAMARRLMIPRTSLFSPLAALERRGLAEQVRVGKRIHWKRSALSLAHSILPFGLELPAGQNHPEFFLHTGKEALRSIQSMIGDAANSRVLFIQPNASLVACLDYFTEAELQDLNTRIKKNKVIMECILQEDVIPHWFRAVKRHGWSAEAMAQTVRGRAADTTFVPKEFFNFNSELGIFPNVAYISNWGSLVSIEIRNQDTIGLLRDVFTFAKQMGKKINLTEQIETEMRD